MTTLKTSVRINKPITVIGWSYGGAIATLCYEDLWFNHPFKRRYAASYWFSRVVGAFPSKFVAQRWIGAKLYSNGFDLVTRLPLPSFDSGINTKLKHIGDKKNSAWDFQS